jgi:predicted ester cyclase
MKIADYWATCGAQLLKKEDVKMSADENLELAKDVIHAYNEHDLDRLLTFWADKEVGQARLEYQKNFWLAAFPDTHMEVISWTAQDDRVILEAIVRMSHLGPLKFWVTDNLPATGKTIEFPICEVTHWKDGKLINIQAYFDRGRILKQLGIVDKVDWEAFD